MIARTRPVCLFDGQCAFCRRWADRLRRMAGEGTEIVAWQESDIASLGVTAEQCNEALQFVDADGRVSSGSDAVAETLLRGRFPWTIAGRILLLPGARAIARRTYRWVARNRHRLGKRSVRKR